jgi:cytochrome c oxidase subunit IV
MSHDSHGHGAHDVQKEVRRYIIVALSLLVGTIVTVGMYYVHLPSVALTIIVALFIASIKGFLVAGYFMHLLDERKMIYGILCMTVFFFIGMMGLLLWTYYNPPSLTLLPAYQGK